MDKFDIDDWINQLKGKLILAFGDRLVLVGIQGSQARGEAQEASDIDTVVVIRDLTRKDIAAYRKIVVEMPCSELACGFLGSPDVLHGWPRHDVLNLINDTRLIYGSFDFMNTTFTSKDAILSAKVGASEIYHALCHTLAFEPQALDDILQACAKNAFFIMRALVFAKTGEYPISRSRMFELADQNEKTLLNIYQDPTSFENKMIVEALLDWSATIIKI